MKTIVLIGAGQLGSRHLQSLSKVNFPARIEVVDTFPASLATAKARFEEMPVNANIREIKFLPSIQELSKNVEFAVVATNADVRSDVVRGLVNFCDVKNILLEKVLFQKICDYTEFLELFDRKNIRVWVNHPRRQYPFYHQLKNWIADSAQVSYQLQGGAWGLACNGLHFIDHLAFLTGETALEVRSDGLNRSVIQSKREGFVEFSGVLNGSLGHHPFTLFCHDMASPLTISILSDKLSVIVDEARGWIRMATKDNGWKWEEREERIIYFQSELTSKVVQEVIGSGRCDLPTYADAVKLHLPFIRCLKMHLEWVENKKYDHCPIT